MKTINLEAKMVTKTVTHTVTTTETKPEQYLRIVRELATFLDEFDTGLSCCPRKNGSLIPCANCKFKKGYERCLQLQLTDVLVRMRHVEE